MFRVVAVDPFIINHAYSRYYIYNMIRPDKPDIYLNFA